MVNLPQPPELSAIPLKPVIIGIIVTVILLVLGYLGLSFQEQRQAQEFAEQQKKNQEVVDELARQVASGLAPIRAKLSKLATSDTVIKLMSSDVAARQEAAGKLADSIEGSLLLRLLPKGQTQSNRQESPPLTFASMDMLRVATESNKQIPVEIHLGGTANEHLVMIERVYLGEELVGFVHLSLSPRVVRDAIAKIAPQNGYLEVRQRAVSGPPVVLARHGSPETLNSTSLVSSVPGTAFLASYRSSSRSTGSSGVGWQIPAAVLAFLLVTAGLVRKRLSSKPKQTAMTVQYAGAIQAVLDGAHPGLEQLLPGGSGKFPEQNAAPSAPVEPVPSGLDLDFDLEEANLEDSSANQLVDHGPADLGIEVSEQISETTTEELATLVPTKIFRSYDIRGVVGESLTADGVYQIGRALGSEAHDRGQQTVVVARDGRNSSQELRDGLIEGLRDAGRDVLDIGLTPTPVLYFATAYLDSHSGVMVTGSHNPPEYNGLKIVLDGKTLSGEAIQAIRDRVESQNYTNGDGSVQSMEIIPDYIRRVGEEVPVTFDALKVVIDCANSVPGIVAPHILRSIGHDVIELFCDVDGNFPNHHPDPSQPENLAALIEAVLAEEADLGLAFDGDGDRLGVVDNKGNIIWPDKQLMLFARDVLKNNPGAKVIYDVKCSRSLPQDIEAHGGEAIMSRTGHSIIKNKMEEVGALLAGDLSGHIFFKDRWYGFDDAMYCAARLLEILVEADRPSADLFAELPGGEVTPEIRIALPEDQHQEFMKKILAAANFEHGEITTLDGLRVDFNDGWGLIRPSNTTPSIVLRFEGNDQAALDRITGEFRTLIKSVDQNLDFA